MTYETIGRNLYTKDSDDLQSKKEGKQIPI